MWGCGDAELREPLRVALIEQQLLVDSRGVLKESAATRNG